MNTETTGAEAPAAEGAQPEATVVTPDATAGQPTDAENPSEASAPSGEEPGADAADKPKRKAWWSDRIDELTRRRHEAERQAEYWKARAEQKVDLDSLDYEDGQAERVSQRLRQEQAETAAATAEQLAAEAYEYRETEARERFADYDTVTRNPNLRITPGMAGLIRESEFGPDIAYHLGKNLAEAARIAALPAQRQAVELGKLEARLTAPKPLPKQPPAPVVPVSAIAAGGTKDPARMSFEEYKAWREAKS